MAYVTSPAHIAAADLSTVTLIVNYRTGGVETLIGPAARWWAELAATGDPASPIALDAESARTLLGRLIDAGLIIPAPHPHPWPVPVAGPTWEPSWGTRELTAGHVLSPPAPLGTTVRVSMALVLVLGVLALGRRRSRLSRLIRLLKWATGHTTRSATSDDAHHAVHAARRIGLWTPGRVACLEESAAATLALAITGRRVRWCHGAAADPIRLHAWVETEHGQPVAEPIPVDRFVPLYTIPRRRER